MLLAFRIQMPRWLGCKLRFDLWNLITFIWGEAEDHLGGGDFSFDVFQGPQRETFEQRQLLVESLNLTYGALSWITRADPRVGIQLFSQIACVYI